MDHVDPHLLAEAGFGRAGFVAVDDADLAGAEKAVRDLLQAFGIDLDNESLRETPGRVARALHDMLTAKPFRLTTFPNEEGYDELIVERNIPFFSLCEHHALPFIGVAHVGYLPKGRLLGLSKLARVVELFARGLQNQERLTSQIANWLCEKLDPNGVGVVMEAEHMCMSLRGVRKRGAITVTSRVMGAVRDDLRTRQEFMALATGRPRSE